MSNKLSPLGLLLGVFLISSIFWACQSNTSPMSHLLYNFEEPDLKIDLPSDLKEISGLSWSPEGDLCAVQDEEGILFRLDPQNGEILSQKRFWKQGDFEGVEVTEDMIWAVKSNGNLYGMKKGGSKSDTLKYKIGRGKGWEIEGLGRDVERKNLLIVAKSISTHSAYKGEGYEVWSFDEYGHKISDAPIRFLADGPEDAEGCFAPPLTPGGMAIHPETKEWYIVSAKNGWISIFEDKEHTHGQGNDQAYFQKCLSELGLPQPEGICFSPDGTLYISSEASGGNPAKLFVYNSLK